MSGRVVGEEWWGVWICGRGGKTAVPTWKLGICRLYRRGITMRSSCILPDPSDYRGITVHRSPSTSASEVQNGSNTRRQAHHQNKWQSTNREDPQHLDGESKSLATQTL